jgi:hypothetical protein
LTISCPLTYSIYAIKDDSKLALNQDTTQGYHEKSMTALILRRLL